MFGAARRGMIGHRVKVLERPGSAPDDVSAMIGAQSYGETQTETSNSCGVLEVTKTTTNTGTTRLTFGGDCGALYLNEDGFPWCMHTVIQGIPKADQKFWTSRGALLQDIVNAHPFYFGSVPGLSDSSTLSSSSSYKAFANRLGSQPGCDKNYNTVKQGELCY